NIDGLTVGDRVEVCVDCLRDFGRVVQPTKHHAARGENHGIGCLRIDEEFDEGFSWTQPRSNQCRTCRVDEGPWLPMAVSNFKWSNALLRVEDPVEQFLAVLP